MTKRTRAPLAVLVAVLCLTGCHLDDTKIEASITREFSAKGVTIKSILVSDNKGNVTWKLKA